MWQTTNEKERYLKLTHKYKYIQIRGVEMSNKNITLSVDSDTYNKYSEYCKKNGIVISKRFELFIRKELKENGVK